jgi:leucine dehydrogenase
VNYFNHPEFHNHEQVVFCHDSSVKLKTIIAIHSTVLGPSLGGTRMWMYESDNEALTDVLRLSRGMTYKAAVAGLNLGGGKAVIIADPQKDKTPELLKSYGRFVQTLGGKYITAEDVGTSVEDLEIVRSVTRYVTGTKKEGGGSGDPSPMTAYGVYRGMKACLKKLTGNDSLTGKTIAVQGAGKVAHYLCCHLAKERAKIFVTDIYPEKAKAIVEETGAQFVKPEEIVTLDVDIVSPCALGAIINDETIPKLRCKIIAGGANNQLADENKHGHMLVERSILYAPDYVINAGGLINVAHELNGYDAEQAKQQTSRIYDTLLKIFDVAERERIPTFEASNRIAEERITQAAHHKQSK